jgi:hypothetical protein
MSSLKALMNGIDTMCKAELVTLCQKFGIDSVGTVASLRYTLKKYYEDNGVPEQELKKAKVDPLSIAALAAGTLPPSPLVPPSVSPVTPATPSTAAASPRCPHGAACPDLHSFRHRVDYVHDGFRQNPIKCRDGLGCAKLKDREHLSKYAHEDAVDKLCKDGTNCPLLHILSHRIQHEHPGFRAQPVTCRDGAACVQITDRGHLYKYAHDLPIPTAGASAPVPSVSPSVTASPAKPVVTTPVPIPAALPKMPPPSPDPDSVSIASPVTAMSSALAAGLSVKGASAATAGKTMADYPLETAPESILIDISKDSEEFWELEEKFAANLQGNNEDYVATRIKNGKKPLRFLLVGAERVVNPVLEARFEIKRQELLATRDPKECRERVSFHGTHPKNLKSILHYSLLRFKHPLNPCKQQVDDGYFGTNKKGIYVSRYADYTLKYSNRVCAVEPGDEVKTIMFRTQPGKSRHIEKLAGAIDPTPGYDSHSSPTFLEWYLFDEAQVCPVYVLRIKAVEDTRTAADDQ